MKEITNTCTTLDVAVSGALVALLILTTILLTLVIIKIVIDLKNADHIQED